VSDVTRLPDAVERGEEQLLSEALAIEDGAEHAAFLQRVAGKNAARGKAKDDVLPQQAGQTIGVRAVRRDRPGKL